MDSPVHPMGLWDGTRHRDLGVYICVGHVRIPWTVPFIPWDCGMGRDTGIWVGGTPLESHEQSRPSHGTVGWDGTPGFEGIHLCGTPLESHEQSRPSHGTVGWDGTAEFGGIHLCGTPLESHGQSHPSHGTVGWDETPGFGGMCLGGTC